MPIFLNHRRILYVIFIFVLAALLAVFVWLEIDARKQQFTSYLDLRAAHANGIIDGEEWSNMRLVGDTGKASSGGTECVKHSCLFASALFSGRWTGGENCKVGNIYSFIDSYVDVSDLRDGHIVSSNRRLYRPVTATVKVQVRRDTNGKPLTLAVSKRASDLEVFTLGRRA